MESQFENTQPTSTPDKLPEGKKLSRRDFLKLMGAAAIDAAVPEILSPKRPTPDQVNEAIRSSRPEVTLHGAQKPETRGKIFTQEETKAIFKSGILPTNKEDEFQIFPLYHAGELGEDGKPTGKTYNLEGSYLLSIHNLEHVRDTPQYPDDKIVSTRLSEIETGEIIALGPVQYEAVGKFQFDTQSPENKERSHFALYDEVAKTLGVENLANNQEAILICYSCSDAIDPKTGKLSPYINNSNLPRQIVVGKAIAIKPKPKPAGVGPY